MAYNYFSGLFNFSNTNNTSSLFGASFYANVTEYSSIKSGSYGKLLRAYYSKDGANEAVSSIAKNTTSDKALTSIKSDADTLADTASKLYTKGSDSVFKDDREDVNEAVKAFVNDYNSLIDSTEDSNTKSITSGASNLINTVKTYATSLDKVGISIDSDGKLSLDEDALAKADDDTVERIFSGTTSIAFQVASKASQIGASAVNATSLFYDSTGSSSGYSYNSSFEDYF